MDSPSDDIQLMKRIAEQDQQAFHDLYHLYGRGVFSLTYRVLQNSALAEEATQDTFVKIWRQHARWDSSKGNLKNWLLAIAHHTAIDRLRQEQRQPALHPEAIEAFEGKPRQFPAKPHEAGWQDGVVLRTLLDQLAKDQARLIELAFFEGLTHTEIADRMGLPLGTVKTRIRTGLQQLRDLWLQATL